MKVDLRSWIAIAATISPVGTIAASPDPLIDLGRLIFFDASLSDPPGQSCGTCHGPTAGWTGPDSPINGAGTAYEGAFKGRFGNRKPPTIT